MDIILQLLFIVGAIVAYANWDRISDSAKEHRKGCAIGCFAVIVVVIAFVCFSRLMAEREMEAEKARIATAERQKQEEEAKRVEMKIDKIRKFALRETPSVWSAYQSLQSEIDLQNAKIEDLRKALRSFDRIPEHDEDFVSICELRNDMLRTRDALWKRLEDAYLAARKFEAAPTRKGNAELLRKAIEDGVAEAVAAAKKFKEMRQSK